MTLEEEERRATEMLAGKVVSTVARHGASEVMIQFSDGTRLYVDGSAGHVELSITGDNDE